MDPREEHKPAGRSGAAAWAVAAGIGAAIWLAVMAARGGFTETDRTLFLHILSDAFFVPGVLLASVGLLIFVAAGGVFDMLSYGVQKVLHLFRFGKGEDTFPKTYFEYKRGNGPAGTWACCSSREPLSWRRSGSSCIFTTADREACAAADEAAGAVGTGRGTEVSCGKGVPDI